MAVGVLPVGRAGAVVTRMHVPCAMRSAACTYLLQTALPSRTTPVRCRGCLARTAAVAAPACTSGAGSRHAAKHMGSGWTDSSGKRFGSSTLQRFNASTSRSPCWNGMRRCRRASLQCLDITIHQRDRHHHRWACRCRCRHRPPHREHGLEVGKRKAHEELGRQHVGHARLRRNLQRGRQGNQPHLQMPGQPGGGCGWGWGPACSASSASVHRGWPGAPSGVTAASGRGCC